MSAYKLQTLGNYPGESVQHSEHGESLKSRKVWLIHVAKCLSPQRNLSMTTLQEILSEWLITCRFFCPTSPYLNPRDLYLWRALKCGVYMNIPHLSGYGKQYSKIHCEYIKMGNIIC